VRRSCWRLRTWPRAGWRTSTWSTWWACPRWSSPRCWTCHGRACTRTGKRPSAVLR
jgi:hypothetical protein